MSSVKAPRFVIKEHFAAAQKDDKGVRKYDVKTASPNLLSLAVLRYPRHHPCSPCYDVRLSILPLASPTRARGQKCIVVGSSTDWRVLLP
jgi:hypothetical protein